MPEPTWASEDGQVQLYLGDCLQVLPTLAAGSVDAVITSPPYNLGDVHHNRNSRHHPYSDAMPESTYQDWQVTILNELYRIARHLFYNHKNRIIDGVQVSPLDWLKRTHWIIKQECVWVNGGPNHDPCRFWPKTERIYWATQLPSLELDNHHFRDIFFWPVVAHSLNGDEHTRAFPIEFPITMLSVLPLAKIVLDPFMGSGTTGVACVQTGRKFIGVEIEPRYFEIAKKRIIEAKMQLRMELS